MSNKKSNHEKARVRLSKLVPSGLMGAVLYTNAADYAEMQPESWQSKGKKPKPKVK